MSHHSMVDLLSSSPLLDSGRRETTGRQRQVVKMNRVMAALHNRETVVYLINTLGPLSQLQIAQLTQLRTSTVSYIIRELMTRGLVQEGSPLPAERVGRKQTPIEMCPNAAWSVGLSLDTMGNKLCLMNAAGHIVCQHSFPSTADVTDFLSAIPSHLDQLVGHYRLAMDKSVGITVSVPGVVDPVAGRVLNSKSFHLENYPLAEELRKKLDQPVMIERNTVCGTYAERYLGCARNCDNFLYFSARPMMASHSTGRRYSFGLAMIMNGDVYRGHNSAAGELHSSDFPQPASTDRGALTAGRALKQRKIAAALRPLAKRLADLVDVLDPEMLVLSSDDWLLTDENMQILKETILKSLIAVPRRELEIARSPLGMDGPLYGAALLGLHRGLKRRLSPSVPEVADVSVPDQERDSKVRAVG